MARRRGWGGKPPVDDDEAARRIVAAAVEGISRTGSAVSIADVAESLGVIRQTVYRYFPSADALMRASAIASVGDFLDRLTDHVQGRRDPADALVEAVVYTLDDVRRTPHLGIMLSGAHSHTDGITSDEAQAFGLTMIRRFDVDWERHGYDDAALSELVEHLLRTMQSFFVSPGNPQRPDAELRRYLQRWLAPVIVAQPGYDAAGRTSDD
ncbi:TetR family transcriptional regulator [Prescottella equi]|uniref:TetR family transcriptional regulator n=1 Tax=Rhodococcus hoagii TaxID=43767 RepID=A0AAE5F3W1_RHOHA|nr:TetR family transcriptional regulator [Prescottella equi]ERN44053.1 tetr family transcriptional regulator [Prescottella equi NBRC 101255 = C 7]MBM4629658.1 TetR family transcriptional regulator [Prescottella equi]ORL26126.1 TetR family transcriptional regulator [Prescottella equi]ORM03126.1 TetR family transcriptional regulator [Prescottella equi]ORM28544.1 TetR family transcriptional regulator [Prescottella equi]